LSLFQIEELLRNKEYFTKKFYKNNYIAYREQKQEYLLIILSGKVQTMISDDKGMIRKIVLLPQYTSIAPAFLFGDNNKFPVDVKSVGESSILFISKNSVLEIISSDKVVLNNYLNIISNKAQILSEKLWKGFSNKTIKKKIIDYFKSNYDENTKIVKFNQSLEELSSYFGVSRPSLSRELNKMVNEGIIKREKRGVYLVENLDKLNDF
jgi:uncharacterized membrane protein